MRERLAPLVFAFSLDGDGPRFLQELGGVDAEGNPVEALLIDTPGVNGQKKNADLLTHRNRFEALGLPATAMALHALQQFAPSGGAGNRTSMRGGGPLTTLVIPAAPHDERPPLWRTILANLCVEEHNDFDPADLPKILRGWRRPLSPTRRTAVASFITAIPTPIRCRRSSACRAASPFSSARAFAA